MFGMMIETGPEYGTIPYSLHDLKVKVTDL